MNNLQREMLINRHYTRVYDDRNRQIGWICKCCDRHAAYLSNMVHRPNCDGLKWEDLPDQLKETTMTTFLVNEVAVVHDEQAHKICLGDSKTYSLLSHVDLKLFLEEFAKTQIKERQKAFRLALGIENHPPGD